jgi:predicted esterase
MTPDTFVFRLARVAFALAWMLAAGMGNPLAAEQLFRLRNGLVIRGSKAEIATLKEGFGAAAAGEIQVRPIWLIDDGLRRIYIHGKGMSDGEPVDINDLEQTIEFWQPKPLGGKAVAGLGSVLGVSPFNEFARRRLTVRGPEGPIVIVQGISELNSRYAKLVAIKGQLNLNWDMRVATSSIDSSSLNTIFGRLMDPSSLDARLEVVRFFIAAERYAEAKQALQDTIEAFPEEADLRPQLAALTEKQAEQLLSEAETRAAAGQYELARGILDNFPLDAVGQITRIQVQDARKKLDDARDSAAALTAQLRQQVAQLDGNQRDGLQGIVDEIAAGLSADTLARLSDYTRLGQAELPLDNRVALAVSGWLLGSGSGQQNLSVAISLVGVRDLVAEYLGAPDPQRRAEILEELRNLEGAEPAYVDRMLPLLLPPLRFPEGSESETIRGLHAIETGKSQYLIQLPPEYNPLREYPCIVALHESRGSPEDQLQWWAGAHSPPADSRRGHASRHGFIVVAPLWSRPGQRLYEYTPHEHERVLTAMRDAMRRASIDADRVFITGHGEGATAAWDLALAHPDLWAGMISISGSPSKTVLHYEPNSRRADAQHGLPMYLVMGELDGSKVDGSIIDDYMTFKHNAMVVMYRGRGREYFYEEIHRLFEWMQLPAHRRKESPRDIEAVTMRAGDQFFWWLELGELKPDVAIDPILWDQSKRIRAAEVSASIGVDNQIRLRGPADQFKVLLRPGDGVDLTQPVVVRYGSRTIRVDFDGSLAEMLEDARQRADRKRPFWLTIPVP